jgi:hypothetical protein
MSGFAAKRVNDFLDYYGERICVLFVRSLCRKVRSSVQSRDYSFETVLPP